MTGELRRLDGARALGEHGQRSCVQPDAARTGACLQDGAPRQLVRERDHRVVPPEHPLRNTPDHRLEGQAGHPAEHIDAATRPEDGGREEHLPRTLRQAPDPGPHRIAHRRRQFCPARRDHLGHEERVPAGCGMQRGRIDVGARRQLADRRHRQRRQRDGHHGGRGDVPERRRQWVVGTDVFVADRHHDERRQLVDAATDDLEQVERGVIGPLDVLDHRDPRATLGPEEAEEGRGHLMAIAHVDCLAQPGRALIGHVQDGPQRSRRSHRVTRAPEHPAFPAAGERLDERALPNASFASHEHESAPVPDRLAE